VFYESGTDRRICALVNGTWRCTALNGTVFYDDANLGSYGLKTGPTAPSQVTLVGNITAYAFAGTGVTVDELFGVIELPHAYIEGGNITPHIHWCPETNATGNVRWYIDYCWVNPDDASAFSSATTINVITAAPAVAKQQTFSNFSAISGTGKKISSHFAFRIYRNPADGSDTYEANAILIAVGLHFQTDGMGSVQITSKT
jgi:hypothetical protein